MWLKVKNPSRSFTIAIFLALGISSIIYILISIIALQTLSLQELFDSKAPFASIYQKLTGNDPFIISIIGLFAVINGALIQIIMASRVIYGLAKKSWLPNILSKLSSRNKTPTLATLIAGAITIAFSLFFDLSTLASFTSGLILVIFILVNISLVKIKLSNKNAPKNKNITYIPIYIPIIGVVLNILLLSSIFIF